MKKMKLNFLILLSMLFFASCSKDEPTPSSTVNSTLLNRQLEVTVHHLYGTQAYEDSSVEGATVRLFANREDRELGLHVLKTGVTDTSGRALFEYLTEDKYHLRVSHPQLKLIDDSVTTPGGATISFLEILYQ